MLSTIGSWKNLLAKLRRKKGSELFLQRRKIVLTPFTIPTQADGDLNGDGHIDSADLDLMFAQYGLGLDVVS